MQFKSLFVIVVGALPAGKIKNYLLRRAGWIIGDNVQIGPSVFVRIKNVSIEGGSRIGPLNVFRDLNLLHMESGSVIGQWNWVSSAPSIAGQQGGKLHLGAESAVTSRHYLDVSGGVIIGSYTTIAGVRSTFVTHGIDWRSSQQRVQQIVVGDYCIVGSNCALTPGVSVASNVVVGMGTVLAKDSALSGNTLVIGPRGSASSNDLSGQYFTRERGFVD
ncbi:hypothetical protein NCCP1664_01980 [Zafaria cholistanensis]|uniref:Acetyltransferase n=1 Tax=Zafaria cholistanensis TaxID=1682741 RepID=A0A5A7NPM3_9MICC|nr:hypothetical protein [Zafaria cholistanensis]GER21701.1 hypothetical protein NCCP1664_01980 [Zafaria cholistanensis]